MLQKVYHQVHKTLKLNVSYKIHQFLALSHPHTLSNNTNLNRIAFIFSSFILDYISRQQNPVRIG